MSLDHGAIVAHIRSAPAVLAAAVAAVPPHRHDRPPRVGEWSAQETLIHVRNVLVMVYGLRIRRLLYERDPVFADYDEAAFRREDLARREPVEDLVRMITAEHEQIAGLLDQLPADRWRERDAIPSWGPCRSHRLEARSARTPRSTPVRSGTPRAL